jgi:hypothetical protein
MGQAVNADFYGIGAGCNSHVYALLRFNQTGLFNNAEKAVRFQAGTAYKAAVNVALAHQGVCIVRLDAAAV